jgi:hypothetical protein
VPAGSVNSAGNANVSVGGSATARTLTGSVANINALIAGGGVTYTTANNASGSVSLSVIINDQGNTGNGGAQQAQTSGTLNITAVNDQPSLTGPVALNTIAGQQVSITGVSYADPDSPSGGISVNATYSAPNGTFTANTNAGVTATGSGTGSLTLSGTITALNAYVIATPVRYNAADPSPVLVVITQGINDLGNTGTGGALSASRTINVTVVPANDGIFGNGFE